MENKIRGKIPVVTVFLVVINIFIWLALQWIGDTRDGEFMLQYGASYYPYVVENGEWWRLITCVFLHFDADHLINNMVMLGIMGMSLEQTIGAIPYGILYLASGLCGSLVSLYEEMRFADYAISAGASGAVFGVVGGLVAWAIWHRGTVAGMNIKKLLTMVVFSLGYGFFTVGVDNWGHIGGLLGGFIVGCIYGIISKIPKPFWKRFQAY